jgi:hypothetical protein
MKLTLINSSQAISCVISLRTIVVSGTISVPIIRALMLYPHHHYPDDWDRHGP